jgi:hypothetical protein
MNNKIEPLKITIEFYNKKISTEVDHSDVKLEELHDLWIDLLRAMGYHEETINEFYNE